MNASYQSVNTAAQAPQAVRENTVLESHLNELRNLTEAIGSAATRAMILGEKLFGSETTPLKGAQSEPKNPEEPPLMSRIEREIRNAIDLAQTLHQHLDKLARL